MTGFESYDRVQVRDDMMRSAKSLLLALIVPSAGFAQLLPNFLHALPHRPQVRAAAYPDCKNEWRKENDRVGRFSAIQDCIDRLEGFNTSELKDFTRRVRAYDRTINIAYANFNKATNPGWMRKAFLGHVQNERDCFKSTDDLGNHGSCYDAYYEMLERYKNDLKTMIRFRETIRRSQ